MKKFLIIFILGLSLSVSAQQEIKTSFNTSSIETAIMNFSNAKGEWVFEDNNDLQDYDAYWRFHLGSNGKGGYIVSGENIIYSVFDWEFTDSGTMLNFYSHSLKEEGSLIIVVRDDGRNSMTFFFPETNKSVTFHQSLK
jgi:hypothetical protein